MFRTAKGKKLREAAEGGVCLLFFGGGRGVQQFHQLIFIYLFFLGGEGVRTNFTYFGKGSITNL